MEREREMRDNRDESVWFSPYSHCWVEKFWENNLG
jgi:hypothetical protein